MSLRTVKERLRQRSSTGKIWDFVIESGLSPLVIVKLDEEIYASGYPNRDCRIYYDFNSLEIMLKSEAEYFEKHFEDYGLWVRINQQLSEGNRLIIEEITKAFFRTELLSRSDQKNIYSHSLPKVGVLVI